MQYKDLNVYKQAYKVAIDLHLYLKGEIKITGQQADGLKATSREILANIAEAFSNTQPKAKRYFNFKALDATRRMIMDLEWLNDTLLLPAEIYMKFNTEYEQVAERLYKENHDILNKETGKIAETTKI
jgi:hypothetical protein